MNIQKNVSKLKNDKYFCGKMADNEKTRGWFVGSFFEEGHPCKTDKVEILYTTHEKGHICKKHYHQEKVEINIMLKGKAIYWINEKPVLVEKGDFIFIDINNVVKAEFLEDCESISIHSPSLPTDKIVVED